MYEWIMIAYLQDHPNGGPIKSEWLTKEACQSAIVEIHKAMPRRFRSPETQAVCLNKKTGTQEGPKYQ